MQDVEYELHFARRAAANRSARVAARSSTRPRVARAENLHARVGIRACDDCRRHARRRRSRPTRCRFAAWRGQLRFARRRDPRPSHFTEHRLAATAPRRRAATDSHRAGRSADHGPRANPQPRTIANPSRADRHSRCASLSFLADRRRHDAAARIDLVHARRLLPLERAARRLVVGQRKRPAIHPRLSAPRRIRAISRRSVRQPGQLRGSGAVLRR